MYKLKVKDVKMVLGTLAMYKAFEVFKSGSRVVLHITNKDFEDIIIKEIHNHHLLCVPETIPSCDYYEIMYRPDTLYAKFKGV